MFQRLDLLVLSCVFLSVECRTTGQISQPQNVSLTWDSGFYPRLSWAPPQDVEKNCTYLVSSEKVPDDLLQENAACDYTMFSSNKTSPWSEFVVMGGGSWKFSVQTVCNGQKSEPVVKNIADQELVTDLQCYVHSSKEANCSWLLPASNIPDLRFFYVLVNEAESNKSANDRSLSSPVQEFSSCSKTGNKTVCCVQANTNNKIHILFNGTLNNTTVRNTFCKWFKEDVRPPVLNWTVIKTENEFLISWTTPDIRVADDWTYTISYTECGKAKEKNITNGNSFNLPRKSNCPYNMMIRAHIKSGGTPWSDNKYFGVDADTGPSALYAVFIIPLVFAGLAILAFVCFRKNKEKIFPKVPEPRDLLSDISDNNNKSTVHNLYIPAMEDECKITLVIDPQTNKLSS